MAVAAKPELPESDPYCPLAMRIPKYRLHKTSGQGLIEWQGQRFYLGRYNTPESLRRYRAKVAQIMEEVGAIEAAPQSGIVDLVPELVLAYLRWLKTDSRREKVQQARTACAHLVRTCPEVPVRDFRPTDFKRARESMVAAGWARSYVNSQCRRIVRMFRWAVEHEMCPATVPATLREVAPLKKGKTTAPDREPVQAVDPAAVAAILPFASKAVAAMVQLQQLTAMRAGEVVLVRPCDVDRSAAVWLYRPERHKGTWLEKGRVVFLGPKAQAVLLPFLAREPQAYCFSPAEAVEERAATARANRKTKVQPSQAARRKKRTPIRAPRARYDTHSYGQAVEYAIAKAIKSGASVPHWTPLQLRHAAATEIRRKHGLEAAQVLLGHSRADVSQVYAARDLDLGIRIAGEVG